MKSLLCVLTTKGVATDGGSCRHSDPTLGRLEALLSMSISCHRPSRYTIIFICGGESRIHDYSCKTPLIHPELQLRAQAHSNPSEPFQRFLALQRSDGVFS